MKRKLIEVALPLEAISAEASLRKRKAPAGYPTTIHRWWAQRPPAACRAVLFASLVDDPSSDPELFPTPHAQEDERRRLFGIIEELVRWENSTNEAVLERARAEIRRSTSGKPPSVLDAFCGGGTIPLEAQRLGLTTYSSDLNPVAVLITKALLEIPSKFAGQPAVHPDARRLGVLASWKGASGLAEDIRRYGAWMRDEAEREIGNMYPKVRLPKEQGGGEATVVAWIWARTVTCPNPVCGAKTPLVRSFALSTTKGKESWIEPVVDRRAKVVRFNVRTGPGHAPGGTVGRVGARCLVCESVVPLDHVRAEGRAGRLDFALMAIVAEGQRSRIFLEASPEHEAIAQSAEPLWAPETDLPDQALGFRVQAYGMTSYRDLFTARQLLALGTFCDLVAKVRERVLDDAVVAGLPDDDQRLAANGAGAPAYADAVATYLAFAISRHADYGNSLATWRPKDSAMRALFARQAIPMVWDFAEGSPFGASSSGLGECTRVVARVLDFLVPAAKATVRQADAASLADQRDMVISTDPPYYSNIGYADLADFFYVWLRRSIGSVYPDLFATLVTPKAAELVATPFRFNGSKEKADQHFESGLSAAFARIREMADPQIPVTVYYAFKQAESESDSDGAGQVTASTGWETMLEALIRSGAWIRGTWPLRTEGDNRQLSVGTNALASSIVLVCRPRSTDAGITTRKEFVVSLKRELPEALRMLQHGNIAPVDLAQASIGPGMGVFSRYARVLEPDGSSMRVRTALELINQALDELLTEQEAEFDADTRWAIAWFEQFGLNEAAYGGAETLSRAKNTSVDGLVEAGIVAASHGHVRLLNRSEYLRDWDPAKDRRLPVWEATQRLVHVLLTDGEAAAGDLLARIGGLGDTARDLAYRLYQVAERKGWTEEGRAYNALVVAWSDLVRRAEQTRRSQPVQANLGLET